jgi:septum formation protein
MLVLASASPRRQELLRNAGIEFVVQAANVDESLIAGESPRESAERLAREKALAVWGKRPEDVVLGADTIVVVDDVILEKPKDTDDAVRMLRMLSGREHRVITGVCIVKSPPFDKLRAGFLAKAARSGAPSPEIDVRSETTVVAVNELSDDEIRAYVATGEPMDKAGAYAIQGRASRWIPRIEGDYCNVVGLPVALVWKMLQEFL